MTEALIMRLVAVDTGELPTSTKEGLINTP
jgi:hypothetical protein